MKIGALAERTGTNAPTIRYYEEIGLLPCPRRREGGQRTYEASDVRRLAFIRRCRDFGFAIAEIRELAQLAEDRTRSCLEASDVAERHLAAIRAKIDELKALERTMSTLVESADPCAGGPGPDCVVLADLADPTKLAHAPGREPGPQN